jgi:hypothetical protein
VRHAAPEAFVVLNAEDRITHVSTPLHGALGHWIGHVLWDHLPGAKEVCGPTFDAARSSGEPVQSVVFYAGRVERLTVIPERDDIAVHIERLAELDVTSLATLTLSLEQIANVLADPASAPHDSRAPASLQALP